MDDIIQKYKKEKTRKNLNIIITSLALALGLNIFLWSTESWKYIQTSVMNSQVWTVEKSDLYFENVKNSWNIQINLQSSKEIHLVKSMSFSLVYNKNNVIIKDKKVNFDGWELVNVIDSNGYNTVIINFKNPMNIKTNETILQIVLEKKVTQKENINILNANITDNQNNIFMLSTSGKEF